MSAVDWDDELRELVDDQREMDGDPCDHCGWPSLPWRDDQPRCNWCPFCDATSCRGAVIIDTDEPLPREFRNAAPGVGDVLDGDPMCVDCLAKGIAELGVTS